MSSKENPPKKKGCDKGIVKRFKMRLDLIFDYNGLVNQGATCYLNSVLQVLFMTKDFREAVESHCGQDRKTADFHLKSLFEALKTSETHTKDILSILGIGNVYEQRDAAEYFENILCMVNPYVSQIFKGHLRHTMRCSEGHVTSVETGPFWTLPLSIENPSDSNKTYSVNCDYELYAVVDHVGSLRGGHYTARIKSYDDHNWYVFDDSYVRQPNPQSISHMNNERSQSVYLLMYKKSRAPDQPGEEEIKKRGGIKVYGRGMEENRRRIEENKRGMEYN
ncbi:ubiquitin carboxyl-terminal hydrolase 47-like isoform X3 [Oncorhynchus nerka]|uniref:ubiquitin carboxyl-terminal hydrolase 47-like isoform X3 n=1 Tax=Oncorhynchus nerka TaxID=8023 RepID=UPI001130C3B0|nr:ubiquitin carboxyl-terminal hydrolase 47-like isoform X3 [Oncorhynchus nerka]